LQKPIKVVTTIGITKRLAAALVIIALLLAVFSVITRPVQSGSSCTLTALQSSVSAGGTLDFNCAADTAITLDVRQLVTKDLTLTNTGAGKLTISGNNLYQIFYVSPNTKLSLTNLNLSGGKAIEGGAIFNSGGTVTITNSSLYNNSADNYGGAIFNSGAVTNYDGDIISNGSTLEITNSSLYNNSADNYGGAIFNNGNVLVTHATFLNNAVSESGSGGTINNNSGTALLKNSLLQGSNICTGNFSLTDGGYNLEVANDNATCGFKTAADAKLGTPGDNGGLTFTIALLEGSSAIDAIPVASCAVTIDQRGISRPQGEACDIGAFEFVPAKPALSSDLIPQLRISPDRVADTNLENLVSFSFKVKNIGAGGASRLLIKIPILQGLDVGYFDASVSSAGVWVTQVTTTTVSIALPPIEQGKEVNGVLVFRPNATAMVGTHIETRYKLVFDDDTVSGKSINSNSQRFVFGATGSNRDDTKGAIQPGAAVRANVGEKVSILQKVYLADEIVSQWYTAPDGSTVSLGRQFSNANGELTIVVDTAGLAAGDYAIVGYGNRSEVTEVNILTVV